jgi:small subunit ribosomal protein S9
MTDEQNNETSEQPEAVDETAEGQEAPAAGPVAEGDPSSSQAVGDTPPPDEAESEPAAVDEAAEQDGEGSDAPAEEPVAEADEAPAEEPAADVEEPETVEEEAPAEKPKAAEKKADVIPGADLEPIAVEPEAPLTTEQRARLEAEEEERARREAELAGAGDEEPTAGRAPAKMESGARFLATGKRKSAIARVTITPGDGKFEVNKRDLKEFFPRPLHQTMARQALVVSGYEGNVDVRVLVHGGGISGQAGAVRHGIARALTKIDAELRGDLKRRGFLTRDARVKERRKAGLKKARKKPQFSKR